MRGFVDQTNYRDILKDFWENKGGRDLLNETYMSFAFNSDDAAMAAVSERGMADILENDGDLVRDVAAISLAASAGLSPEGLRLMSTDLDVNCMAAIQRAGKLWPFPNLPLAGLDEDGFLTSAF
jgi:hypothetical protein